MIKILPSIYTVNVNSIEKNQKLKTKIKIHPLKN